MKSIVPIIVAILILGVGTAYHGVMTERWTPRRSESLSEFTELVKNVPTTFGDWVGEDEEVDPEQWKQTNCTAYVQRAYKHRETGEVVSFYLVSGSGRNITIHSPDWCYRAVGYVSDTDPKPYLAPAEGLSSSVEFSTAVFRRPTGSGGDSVLRIFWTYSDDGRWSGPKWAKLVLTSRPALYKIYLICPIKPGTSSEAEDTPAAKFVAEVFPKLNKILFPAEKPAAEST